MNSDYKKNEAGIDDMARGGLHSLYCMVCRPSTLNEVKSVIDIGPVNIVTRKCPKCGFENDYIYGK